MQDRMTASSHLLIGLGAAAAMAGRTIAHYGRVDPYVWTSWATWSWTGAAPRSCSRSAPTRGGQQRRGRLHPGVSPGSFVRNRGYAVTILGIGFVGGLPKPVGTAGLRVTGPGRVSFTAVTVIDSTHIAATITFGRRPAATGLKVTGISLSNGHPKRAVAAT